MSTPLDFDALSEVTEGDRELEKQLFDLYHQTVERCLAALRSNLVDDRSNGWKVAAHELKGASANMHALEMAALCRAAEALPLDTSRRSVMCQDIEAAYRRVQDFVSRTR